MTTDPKALAARLREVVGQLEKATGPDREIDALIWAIIVEQRTVRYNNGMLLGRSPDPPHDECLLGYIDPGKHQRNFTIATGFVPPIPFYTASLDAAVALCERMLPDTNIDIQSTVVDGRRVWAVDLVTGGDYWGASYPNAALALCLAICRALT